MTGNISYSWQENLSTTSSERHLFVRRHDLPNAPVDVFYGIAQSWFGDCLVATTAKGICWLDIAPGAGSLDELGRVWRGCPLVCNESRVKSLARRIFADQPESLPVHMCGTAFQLDVWRALTGIRPGYCMTYGQIAQCIGRPQAARAVGSAVGANGIALLIPCHRVLPANRQPGSYRWGSTLKQALLQRERMVAAA